MSENGIVGHVFGFCVCAQNEYAWSVSVCVGCVGWADGPAPILK